MARIETSPDEWMMSLLFVVQDFSAMRINTFRPESGAWPPPLGSLLLERSALPLLKAKVGESRRVQAPHGPKRETVIAGLVHDPGLAPAWQEQNAYGYITPDTLAWLGETSTLHLLKVMVKDQPMNAPAIERTMGELTQWLRQQGHTVGEIRIPPPGKHPHQSQMTAILVLLLVFSLMALVLSAVLNATMINGLLAQQVRQIGIMKAMGARSWQIADLYLVMVLGVGIAAVVIGLWPGIAAGRGLAHVVAQLLNFTLYSQAIPGWVYGVQVLVGILVPGLSALIPIFGATRTTVREAINNFGTNPQAFGSRRLDVWLGKIRGLDRTLVLALRNTFRRRGRLLLTMGLLAAAGGMFITSLNVKAAWERNLQIAAESRHYDLEIRLNDPQPEKKLQAVIVQVNSVQRVEAWNILPAAVSRPDGLDIVRTYPDEGHGSFTLRSAPAGSTLVSQPLMSGHRLQPGAGDEVVLNHTALMLLNRTTPGLAAPLKAGDLVRLSVAGRPVTVRLAGVVREILTPAAAYVSPETFARTAGWAGQTNAVRIVFRAHDARSRKAITREIEDALEHAGFSLDKVISETALDKAVSGHVYLFIFMLIFMSGLMAIVGALGLMSAMGANVTERTREFGIMRTLGARRSVIVRNVISEGIFVGLMSGVAALGLSLPASLVIGNMLGMMSFSIPLPLVLSPQAVLIWALIIALGSAAASAYPAWKAASLTVRETLAYL
jgi:putative ABC transport system permease protein